MSQPYVGEIRMGGWNFAPVGWAMCNGQVMPIDQNDVLFSLIGTTYGGDGQTTFALPNLQSRVPVHVGSGFALAQTGGAESVTLTSAQIPAHSHPFLCSQNPGTQANPAGNAPATLAIGAGSAYNQDPPTDALAAQSIGSTGGSQPHDNMQPFLCITFIISLYGVYPSQS
ncbi:MAG: phage tail protein [Streptosporangiaceae bacterium]